MNIIKMISNFNFNPGTIDRLKDGYIVIHYTGALGSAKQSCQYFAGGDRQASAHFFVDYNGDVYQSVEEKNIAWHCGATSYKHPKCRNANSIGIELCCKTKGSTSIADANWYFEDATVTSAIALTKELMVKYNIPADHVIRHYDVTGKTCPAPYVFNTGRHSWNQFEAAIKSTSTSLSKNQNETISQEETAKIGWNAFISAGYSTIAAAALLGNLNAESGLKANNLQNSYERSLGVTDETYTSTIDSRKYSKEQFYNDKAGYGLAQWTFWTRKKAMYEYIVEKLKKSIGDTKAQFDFLIHELSTSYPGLVNKLKSSKTIKEASDLVLVEYERPADQSDSMKTLRASYGEEFYKRFVGKPSNEATNIICPFLVNVTITDLNIRKGPSTKYETIGKYTGKGIFTIVEVANGSGSTSGWGLLKAYEMKKDGWISLDHVKKL